MAACALCAPAAPAAGDDATLELYVNQPEELALQALRLDVDGRERPVALHAGGAEGPVYAGTLAPGVHELGVEATYQGRSAVFTYLEGYRFRMRGRGKLEVAGGEVVRVHSRVLSRKGITVQWQDQPYLSLTAVTGHAARRIDVEPQEGEPAAAAAPAPGPAPPPAEASAPAPAPEPPAAAPAEPARAPGGEGCSLAAVRFAFARADLGEAARAALDRFAACLARTGAAIRLEGHCDARGPEAYNLRLGEERARAAARYLEERGVAPGRISVRSFGKERPLCTAQGAECAARNRRVEAVLR